VREHIFPTPAASLAPRFVTEARLFLVKASPARYGLA
jgi:hypothetical protein